MRAGREFAPQTGSPVTASSASESGLWGVISRWGENRRHSRRLGWGAPSLWSAISGISALAGRVSGSGLWWRFSNFRFGGAETGSTADSVDAVFRPVLG